MLETLGVTAEQAQTYCQIVSEYLAKPSFETAIGLIQNLGNISNQRIERYLASARQFRANRVVKGLMFFGIRIGKIHNRLVKGVQAAIP